MKENLDILDSKNITIIIAIDITIAITISQNTS